ncbi:MAG: shikimate dehydrogenase [candidate division KSB1 bacterium]|nr:shikimate dehydrogenase [candidate division KSB1 bacterium]
MPAKRSGVRQSRTTGPCQAVVRGSTRVVGIIGDPVDHSLSPLMHNAAFAALGLDWIYVPFPVKSPALREALRGLRALGVVGVNVTVPHKEAALRFLDDVSLVAQKVGAVNTVIVRNERLEGENTDVHGVRQALRGLRLRSATALVIGAGGAARAVLAALEEAGARRVIVANRTLARARSLQRRFSTSSFRVEARSLESLIDPELLKSVQLVVNSTSIGLHGETFPPLAIECTRRECVFFDLIYGRATDFLAKARAVGRPTMDGTEMLLHQGAEAFRLWTGRRPPIEVMRTALAEASRR